MAKPIIRELGLVAYQETWKKMQAFTKERTPETNDEIWFLQHQPVFTQGQAGRPEHILNPGTIPIVQTDRGGQVTYHGPGQLVVYFLVDLHRRHYGIKHFVHALEQAIVTLLAEYNITAAPKVGAPGVYVDGAKICSIGLKVSHGCTYHGIALNVAMDLEPFSRINPCGFNNLTMTQISAFIPSVTIAEIESKLYKQLLSKLGYEQ